MGSYIKELHVASLWRHLLYKWRVAIQWFPRKPRVIVYSRCITLVVRRAVLPLTWLTADKMSWHGRMHNVLNMYFYTFYTLVWRVWRLLSLLIFCFANLQTWAWVYPSCTVSCNKSNFTHLLLRKASENSQFGASFVHSSLLPEMYKTLLHTMLCQESYEMCSFICGSHLYFSHDGRHHSLF